MNDVYKSKNPTKSLPVNLQRAWTRIKSDREFKKAELLIDIDKTIHAFAWGETEFSCIIIYLTGMFALRQRSNAKKKKMAFDLKQSSE